MSRTIAQTLLLVAAGSVAQHPWAERVGDEIGVEALRQALATMRALNESA